MKGREFADALGALEKVRGLRHQRSETVHEAVGAVLAWIGARRLRAAASGDPEAAPDRRLVAHLADLEAAAVRLDMIPSRGATLPRRREAWAEIRALTVKITTLLNVERVTRLGQEDGRRSAG